MKNDDAPKGEVFYDQFDADGQRFYKKFEDDKTDTASLLKSSEAYSKSSNPDGKKIALLLHGLYFREVGIKESDPKKSSRLLHKACVQFAKVTGTKSIEYKRVKLEYLKKKLTEDKDKPPIKLFLERAKLFKDLGDIKSHHADMALYYMFSMLEEAEKDRFSDRITELADLMLASAKESGHQELLYKTQVLYHRVKSGTAHDPKTSAAEMEEVLKAIEKTSDHFGKGEAEADLLFTKAMITPSKVKRTEMLKDAVHKWNQLGNKKQAVNTIKMLLPMPAKVVVMLKLIDEAIESQQTLNKKIHELIKITPGPYSLFHHHSHLIERIKDMKNVLRRLGLNKKELTDLAIKENSLKPYKIIPGKPLPKPVQKLHQRSQHLTELMKLDMESLYVFGNLLLDQWAHVIAYLLGVANPELFNFQQLYEIMSSNGDKGVLNAVWDKHHPDIYWLYYQIRSYRNIFIEHVRRPWQRGNTMSVYGDDFNLFIPTPPGWLDDKDVAKQIKSIGYLAPEELKRMPDDYWEKKSLKRTLELTFNSIDRIPKKIDREKVWDIWKEVGGSTPSYDVIASRLVRFMHDSPNTVIDIISANPDLINLGAPVKKKQE